MMFVKYVGYRSKMTPRLKIWTVMGLEKWLILESICHASIRTPVRLPEPMAKVWHDAVCLEFQHCGVETGRSLDLAG